MKLDTNSTLFYLLDRLPKDLPVIVVAAGPSLNKNVDKLTEVQDRALIACTDRAVGALVKHGIRPHLIVTVDISKDTDYIRFDSMSDVPVMASFQIDPNTLEYADGRIIFFHAIYLEGELPGLKGKIIGQGDLGGNVATATYVTFAQAGFKNVILIGQDLAMLGNKHHADDNAEGEFESGEFIEVEGIDGGTVRSHLDWVSFRDQYEQFIKGMPDTHCIDATEGGALIHGSEVMTLQAAIERYCTVEYDIQRMLSDLPRAQTPEQHAETMAMLSGWADDLDRFIETGAEIKELLEQLLKVARYNDITDRKHAKKLNRLDELRKSLLDHELYAVLKDHWIRLRSTVPDRSYMLRNNEEAIPVLEHAIAFYEELPDNCKSLQEAICQVLDTDKEKKV